MRSDWKECKLGDIVSFSQGLQVSVESQFLEKDDGLSRFVRIIDFTNDTEPPRYIKTPDKKQFVDVDDIVMIRYGSQTAGKVVRGKSGFIANNMFKVAIKVNFIDKNYLFHYLSSKTIYDFLRYTQSSSTMPAITFGMLKPILIRYPSLRSQNIIAKVANDISIKIELNRQINQTLEAMAQALFKSWFVDFDPVKAKLAAKAAGADDEGVTLAAMEALSGQNAEALRKLAHTEPERYAELKATAELFPEALVESELGEIPAGWEVGQIGKQVKCMGGGTPPTKNTEFWEDGHIYWTTPKDLSGNSNKILLDTSRKITEAGLNKISSGLLPVNTVLMSSRAPVGYLALAKVPLAINQGYIAMICDQNLSSEYVIQWAEANMDEVKQRAEGTTFSEISKKNFREILVLVPSTQVIKSYSDLVKAYYDQITSLVQECNSLTELRDTLLPKLLSGEISVDDVELPNLDTQEPSHD